MYNTQYVTHFINNVFYIIILFIIISLNFYYVHVTDITLYYAITILLYYFMLNTNITQFYHTNTMVEHYNTIQYSVTIYCTTIHTIQILDYHTLYKFCTSMLYYTIYYIPILLHLLYTFYLLYYYVFYTDITLFLYNTATVLLTY